MLECRAHKDPKVCRGMFPWVIDVEMFMICEKIEDPYWHSGRGVYDIRQRREDGLLPVYSSLCLILALLGTILKHR
jgi:hypothetical protein